MSLQYLHNSTHFEVYGINTFGGVWDKPNHKQKYITPKPLTKGASQERALFFNE